MCSSTAEMCVLLTIVFLAPSSFCHMVKWLPLLPHPSCLFDEKTPFPLKHLLHVVYLALNPSVLQKSCTCQSCSWNFSVKGLKGRLLPLELAKLQMNLGLLTAVLPAMWMLLVLHLDPLHRAGWGRLAQPFLIHSP